jgi:hypothetical protein
VASPNVATPDLLTFNDQVTLPADYERLVAEHPVKPRENIRSLSLGEAALHGLPGRIVKKLAPETESDPAAMLIEILAKFGNLIGRSAYYEVEDTQHFGNIFAVKVGVSSKARKGTAGSRINKIFTQVDRAWNNACNSSGLSSGEGLIYAIRDDVTNDEGKILEAGVEDKRLLVREAEFARVLAANKRESSTLSPVLRDAWDGNRLRNLTRGRGRDNSPLEATDPHISIIGDITQEELTMAISNSDTYNGFANRFLWVRTERNG